MAASSSSSSPSEQFNLILQVTDLKKLIADSGLRSQHQRIRDAIEKTHDVIRDEFIEDKIFKSVSKKVKRLYDALDNGSDPAVDDALDRLSEKVKMVLSGDDMLKSFVVFERSLLGDEYDHRRGVFETTDGETHLKPKKFLVKSKPKIDKTGCPANEENRGDYLAALKLYPGEVESVDWVIDDLLYSMALNMPGNIEIDGIKMRSQVEADIFRLSSIVVDGDVIHKLGMGISGSGREKARDLYETLIGAMSSDSALTHQLTKLITQASLARPYFLLFEKLIKPDLMFHLTTLDNHFYISTKTASGYPGSDVVVKEVAHFAVMDYSATLSTGEQAVVGYLKFIRIMVLDRELLKKATATGSTATDYNSQFYQTMEEMEGFDVPLPAVTPLPYSCSIL